MTYALFDNKGYYPLFKDIHTSNNWSSFSSNGLPSVRFINWATPEGKNRYSSDGKLIRHTQTIKINDHSSFTHSVLMERNSPLGLTVPAVDVIKMPLITQKG